MELIRFCGGRLTVTSILVGLLCLATWQSPRAQADDGAILSSQTRQRLFDELAAEFTALERQGNLLKKVVRLATPTVVHIEARKQADARNGYRRKPLEEAGSGVIVDIDNKLYVVTNRHVISDAPNASIEIRFSDGRSLHPTGVWSDRFTDVAVMSLSAENLIAARIGDSERIEIGDFVLAVGSPFGLSHSVTYGIISAKGRRDLQLGDGHIIYQDFLQTDAAINPGNSGGPLLNLRGEVIGINTAIASSSGGSEGIGFTIPINMAITVARQLVADGRATRAYLGVRLVPHEDFSVEMASRLGLPRPYGALVRSITPNSPAEAAHLQPHDVIVRFDGRRVEDDDHLVKIVGFTSIGKEVDLMVMRDGQTITLRIKLDERSRYEPEE